MLLSGPVRSAFTLRIAALALMLLALIVLPGCWVQSINGLNEAGPFSYDKDQIYDSDLLGTWTMTDQQNCLVTTQITADGKDYHWKVTSSGTGCDNEHEVQTNNYDGQLFKLNDHRFLDLTAGPDEKVCQACTRVHWIFKVDAGNDSLSLIPIDSEWLEKAEKERTVTLPTAHEDSDMLTASPKDLKDFCRKYAADANVFKPSPDSTFRRKQP
jgi:hypothetical protein